MSPINSVYSVAARAAQWQIPPHPRVWAESRMRFNAGVESAPSYVADKAPYHRPLFDWWADREVQEILFHKSAQAGGSVMLNTLIAYAAENDPGPAMFIEPTESLTKAFIRRRLRPALAATLPGTISDSQRDSEWTQNGGMVRGMLIVPAWATSEVQLRSWPIRYVFGDELSAWKFDRQYVLDRTAQFPANKKAFWVTTPTEETEQSWYLREHVFQRWSWAVPCPHCGKFIVLHWSNLQFKHCRNKDDSWDYERVERDAEYSCQECSKSISQKHRAEMLRNGREVCETPERSKRKIAFRVSALDVPARPWGTTARTFLDAKDKPEALKVFFNQQLTEPFLEKRESIEAKDVRARTYGLSGGICPANTRYLVSGMDVQRGHVYGVVRAWLDDGRSVLVSCEHVEGRDGTGKGTDEEHVALSTRRALARYWSDVMMRPWAWEGHTEKLLIAVVAADSGDGMVTKIVYAWAAEHRDRVVPIKGENAMTQIMRWTDLDQPPGLRLGIVNTSHYRDVVLESYRQSSDEAGAWLLNGGIPDEYFEHLLSWQTVEAEVRDKLGLLKRIKREWRRVGAKPDHYLDAEIYCAAIQENRPGLRQITVNVDGAGKIVPPAPPVIPRRLPPPRTINRVY